MNHSRQTILAVVMVVFGMMLITAAFVVPPTGIIDPTVLTAFGEMLTFAGSLIGIDYHYRYKKDPPQPSLEGREKSQSRPPGTSAVNN